MKPPPPIPPEELAPPRRAILKNRRESDTIKFRHGGRNFYVTFSALPDGGLAEVFLDGGRPGSELKIACIEAATAASLALQYGAPAETLLNAMPRLDDGSQAGPLGAALRRALGADYGRPRDNWRKPIEGEVKVQ